WRWRGSRRRQSRSAPGQERAGGQLQSTSLASSVGCATQARSIIGNGTTSSSAQACGRQPRKYDRRQMISDHHEQRRLRWGSPMIKRGLILGLVLLTLAHTAPAQDMMRHVDLTSPEMTSAEMTRAEVETALAAATAERPADFTGKKLSGLDLSGL